MVVPCGLPHLSSVSKCLPILYFVLGARHYLLLSSTEWTLPSPWRQLGKVSGFLPLIPNSLEEPIHVRSNQNLDVLEKEKGVSR